MAYSEISQRCCLPCWFSLFTCFEYSRFFAEQFSARTVYLPEKEIFILTLSYISRCRGNIMAFVHSSQPFSFLSLFSSTEVPFMGSREDQAPLRIEMTQWRGVARRQCRQRWLTNTRSQSSPKNPLFFMSPPALPAFTNLANKSRSHCFEILFETL